MTDHGLGQIQATAYARIQSELDSGILQLWQLQWEVVYAANSDTYPANDALGVADRNRMIADILADLQSSGVLLGEALPSPSGLRFVPWAVQGKDALTNVCNLLESSVEGFDMSHEIYLSSHGQGVAPR